jgi:hypothetical protein
MSPDPTRIIITNPPAQTKINAAQEFYTLFDRNSTLDEYQKKIKYEDSNFVINKCMDAEKLIEHSDREAFFESRRNVLLWGKVQSGKTASLISLCALARTKGFRIIIILAAATNTLLDQTQKRFRQDLGDYPADNLLWGQGHHGFYLIKRSNGVDLELFNINAFTSNKSSDKTSIIFILKNSSQLTKIKAAIDSISPEINDAGILIIDDESDQSTNSRAQRNLRTGRNDEIAKYAALKNLYKTSVRVSLVQSTATPEAHFFAEQYDNLKPRFVKIVKPGDGYIGGSDLFNPNHQISPYLEDLGQMQDLQFLPALIHFFLSCMKNEMDLIKADIVYENNKSKWIRTMIFHPGVRRSAHRKSKDIIDRHIKTIREFLEMGDFSHFENEYAQWAKRTKTNTPLSVLMEYRYILSPTNLSTTQFNSDSDAQAYDYRTHKYHILFGGILLDRGVTIPNLMVTFIERPPIGSGAIDSIQQWARFFGYKKSFKDHIRIYMTRELRVHFENFVRHEEELRSELEGWEDKGLDAWELESNMEMYVGSGSVTRPTNIGRHILEIRMNKAGWINPNKNIVPSIEDQEADQYYREFTQLRKLVVDRFEEKGFQELRKRGIVDFNDFRSEATNSHAYFLISHTDSHGIFEHILKIFPRQNNDAIKNMFKRMVKDKRDVLLIFMHGSKENHAIQRTMRDDGSIAPYEGPSPADGSKYSGDRAVYAGDYLTIQLRLVNIEYKDQFTSMDNFPWVVIRPPSNAGNYVTLRN